MKKSFYTLLLFTVCVSSLLSGCKKPEACLEVNESPKKDVTTTIDATCSQNARWFDFYIDGTYKGGGFSGDIEYTFTTVGKHTVKVTIFKNYNGTTNSRSGTCTGCSGSGKSSTIEKEVNVTN